MNKLCRLWLGSKDYNPATVVMNCFDLLCVGL